MTDWDEELRRLQRDLRSTRNYTTMLLSGVFTFIFLCATYYWLQDPHSAFRLTLFTISLVGGATITIGLHVWLEYQEPKILKQQWALMMAVERTENANKKSLPLSPIAERLQRAIRARIFSDK